MTINVDNFAIRLKRRFFKTSADSAAWAILTYDTRDEAATEVAGQPIEHESEQEEVKWFDLLMLQLQLAALNVEPLFEHLRDQVKEIDAQLRQLVTRIEW